MTEKSNAADHYDYVQRADKDDDDSLIVKEWSHQLLSHKKAFRSSAVLPIITGLQTMIIINSSPD